MKQREAVDQQRKQRATELMAGEGNDLYIMAEIEFYDIQKVKQSGAFEELSPYFENDPEMDRNLFLDGIFEMEEDGTCHILPYTISAGFLGTTEKILRLEGISLQDCETYGEQIACMVQYHRQYADRAAVAPRGSFLFRSGWFGICAMGIGGERSDPFLGNPEKCGNAQQRGGSL